MVGKRFPRNFVAFASKASANPKFSQEFFKVLANRDFGGLFADSLAGKAISTRLSTPFSLTGPIFDVELKASGRCAFSEAAYE